MHAYRTAIAVIAGLVLAGLAPITTSPEPAMAGPAPDNRPNILLITTDDQTLADMRYMPITRRLLGNQGVTFHNMLSPHPLCCPARAEILTGQFAQNNGVRSNTRRFHGGWSHLDHRHTIATWLAAAGYRTGFVGKYLNEYSVLASAHEPGWDIWSPLLRYFRYFGYMLFEDGVRKKFPGIHSSDLVGQRTAAYIRQLAPSDKPFFIWSSHYAPHGECRDEHCSSPAVPARRHAHLFPHAMSPSLRDPAYNEDDVSDKPNYIARLPKQSAARMNQQFRSRIRALQAVDEAVRSAVTALEQTGELGNTLIMFTSDNGFLLGEHRYFTKDVPYEQALRVPLLMRGPGIPHRVQRRQVVTMVDLAPTIVDAANARPDLAIDGRSLLPVARANAPGWGTVLIQSGPKTPAQLDNGWSFRGVRTTRYTYVRYPDPYFLELYDRKKDPHEMRNVAHEEKYRKVRHDLSHRLKALIHCKGASCRKRF